MQGWNVGVARTDFTIFDRDAEMMGWAQPRNRAHAVASPLQCRAFVFEDPATGARVAIAVLEICFVSESIRRQVADAVADDGIPEANLMLLATHTHSGPGGYSWDLAYTMTTPGFRPHILAHLVEGTVTAIREAARGLKPARVEAAETVIPLSEPVAFNRSPRAWNANPGVRKVRWEDRHLATDRTMWLLRIVGEDGTPMGCLSFFAVHCTSVHSDQRWLNGDNKGYASDALEAWAREAWDVDYVAAFAQGAAGDVSPNFRWDPHRGLRVGVYDDDFASARLVGEIQAGQAWARLQRAGWTPLEGTLDAAMRWTDFHDAPVDPQHAGGIRGRRTGFAQYGMGFLEGTEEGPGPMLELRTLNQVLHRSVGAAKRVAGWMGLHPEGALDAQGPKYTFLQTGRGGSGLAFGFFSMGDPQAPDWLDATVAEARRLHRSGTLGSRPWTAHILPLQVVRLGPWAVVGIPMEATTRAGQRIGALVQEGLAASGVGTVVPAAYANGYVGYLTTREEYLCQCYEGSSTVFGQWTLGAVLTALDSVVARLGVPAGERPVLHDPRPVPLTEAELAARSQVVHHHSPLARLMR
jgi:neutral ceramidase